MPKTREEMLRFLSDRVVRAGGHNLDLSPRPESANRKLLEKLSDPVLEYLVEDVVQRSPKDEFDMPSQIEWPYRDWSHWHCLRPMRVSRLREAICPKCGGRFFSAELVLGRKPLTPEVEAVIDSILREVGHSGNAYELELLKPDLRVTFHDKGLEELQHVLDWYVNARQEREKLLDSLAQRAQEHYQQIAAPI